MADVVPATNPWLDALSSLEMELGEAPRRGDVRARQAACLTAYASSYNASVAAERAGISRMAIWRWRREDPVFERAWVQAENSVAEDVYAEVFRRATVGVEVVVRDRMGREVAREHRPSDRLLLGLARKFDPDGFGEGRNMARRTSPPDESWRETLLAAARDPALLAELDAMAARLTAATITTPQPTRIRALGRVVDIPDLGGDAA